MQPRTLDQVLGELNSTYKPQIESIRKKQALIPGQLAEEEKGLQAKQEQAFGDILGGARRRGLGFSGIPLSEQAKYTSTEFLPALARLRQTGREQAMSLEDAILGIRERRDTLAQQIRQQEVDRAEQRRQFNENLRFQREQSAQSRAAANSFSPTLGGGRASSAPAPRMQQRADKGFNFQDTSGRSISAAQYASLAGQDIRDVLYDMGRGGDAYAAQLYNQLSDPLTFKDFQKRPDVYKRLYSPIFWGS